MNIRRQALSDKLLLVVISLVIVGQGLLLPSTVSAAACQVPSVDYGSASASFSVPSSTTYRLWSRIMVPDGTNTTYLLEIDGATCYRVGGGSIPANTWTWIDYQSASPSSKIQRSLTAGTHMMKMIGDAPGVKVDRLVAVSDLNCVPVGLGDNCNVPDDTTTPTVSLNAPAEGSIVSGSVNLQAQANDNVGVAKVDFYDNSQLISSDTTAPYEATLDTRFAPNGAHVLGVRAYDAAGNVGLDSNSVTFRNGDAIAPSVPLSVAAAARAYNLVSVTWAASTDAVGVTGYDIVRNGVTIASVGALTTYEDSTTAPNTAYRYQVRAADAAGNKSALSTAASVTTPAVPDTTPPAAPTGVTATAVSTSQINLTWAGATDNIGVVSYDVFRGATKVATVTTTSYGDTGLQSGTSYSYTVKARDAAGNISSASAVAVASTNAVQTKAALSGLITRGNGAPLSGARVVVTVSSTSKLVYRTGADGRYQLVLPSGGTYTATYSKRGFVRQQVTFTVQNGEVLTKNIVLRKQR